MTGETVFDQAADGTPSPARFEGGGLAIKEAGWPADPVGATASPAGQVDAGTLTSAAERFTGDVAIGDAGTLNFEQYRRRRLWRSNLTGSARC